MSVLTLKNKIRKVIPFFCLPVLLLSYLIVFAQETETFESEDSLTELQKEAINYRQEGVKAQDAGDLDSAMKMYQKAVEIDSYYAVAYNDLGVIYEAKGEAERAEESYIKAIRIDPYFLSAYSNLALFYEGKRDLAKAAYCWKKRAELGNLEDPWTQKAKSRIEDIRMSLSANPLADAQERQVVGLMKDIANEKDILRHDDKAMARKHFKKAKESYNKQDYAAAVKEALDAQYLDQDNKEIEEFITQAQKRALSR
ncbi:MAG: tetratricopeptide repeat protein [Candidatus Omnitrophica bacterium]|nr:tetratricopeptide repeat protein [Candidatus Omnitrophota bacterium]